ncbi:hypothetical protein PHAVU_009G114175 [Phaseolus vulgaris]|uniref:Uncharacterized protein n=1 Tax=Phaseolus vulgaris TaxID=3885 RepID=V7B4U3_PHAVU|nr:hypothetical protein PHAVU_008G145100g [Phaseolus vulgaris]ESW12824.1 hypothetical protein PHAVU_008G145100g [Phaseolus vulgaris]
MEERRERLRLRLRHRERATLYCWCPCLIYERMGNEPSLAAFTLGVSFFVSLSKDSERERKRERRKGPKWGSLIGWRRKLMQALSILGLGKAGERPFSTFSLFLFLVILTLLSLPCHHSTLFSLSISLWCV